jgi:SAM-dependent methyltransferase
MTERNPLERARELASPDAAKALYDDWAERYDADVFDTMGVIGSRRVADLLAEHVPDRSTSVLDLGCGTGVVGQHLAEHGFAAITGIDFSPAMLAVAERRGVYRRLVEGDLNDPPPLTARCEASVSAGTFTTGHVTADAVAGLLDLHTPGAIIVWSVAPVFWPSFDTRLRAASVTIVSSAVEPIRTDRDDRSHMVVGVIDTG